MYYHKFDEKNKEFPYAVGHYDPKGDFITVVRFKHESNASDRVKRLNGGKTTIIKQKSSGHYFADPC